MAGRVAGHRGAVDGTMRADMLAALPRLRRFCDGLCRQGGDGDELMQATVERALARSHQFVPGTRVDSWLFRIAQNMFIDDRRRDRRRGAHVPVDDIVTLAGDDGRTVVEHRSELATVYRALDLLPPDQRAAFLLVAVEGQSYREAAEILDIPQGTVMSRLARARARIATILDASNPDSVPEGQ
jgi:RNA polymerase sigma-70 factor (ECF subfamily)